MKKDSSMQDVSNTNSVKRHCSLSVLVVQWIERQPGVQEVMDFIPVGYSDFFFVLRSCHVD